MAGHVITDFFKRSDDFQVFYTSRDPNDSNSIYVEAENFQALAHIIKDMQPDIVVNAIGVLNQFAESNIVNAIKINSLLPHFLARELDKNGGKLIHISSDCVFSGKEGSYKETDVPNGSTVYARTKALGEVAYGNHLTIRTSIIGPEKKENGIGLFLWFMQQKGEINGYKKVLWNGVTTLELAKAIKAAVCQKIKGLYHLAAPEVVSKYELLVLFQKIFEKKDVVIKPEYSQMIDRTLVNTRTDFDFSASDYQTMLLELKNWMHSYG